MNLLKIFFIIIINLFVIVFMTQNSTDRISIQFFNWGIQDAYLNVVLLFTMIFGIIAGFLSAAIIIFYHKSEIKILKNKNKNLTNELNDLRNVAIEEGVYDEEVEEY